MVRLQAAIQEETAKRRGAESALRDAYETIEKQRLAAQTQARLTESEVTQLRRAADDGDDARRTLAGRQLGIDKALADADTALRECEDMRREAETARRRAAEAEEKAAFAQAEVARASAREESALAAEKRRNRGRIENLERRSEAAERARRQSDQVGL